MLFNKYQKVQHLEPEKTEWTIRVRAQSIWEGINRTTMEFRGLNVIFIDDSNCRIHAFVSSKIADLFKNDLKEGGIFTISNFHVRKYEGDEKDRAVRFEKHIYFDNYTKLVVESDNVTEIAPYAFDFCDFDDVQTSVKDPRFLIDVVGMLAVKNAEYVHPRDDKNSSYLKFRITDGRSNLSVTFFNKLGEDLEKQIKEIKDEEVAIIIASAKVKEYDGAPCLNNYPATRFYLNPQHFSVNILKKRIAEAPIGIIPNEAEVYNEPVPDEKFYTVAEIKKFTAEYCQRKVRCQITVKKVEEKSSWFCEVCTACGDEVNIVEGRYKCLQCNRNVPFPDKRFRLATVCKDSTGFLGIVFPDEEIQRITGKNVFDVENDDSQVGDEISFPPLLKSFEKKDYIVTLEIGEENVSKSCNVYNAYAIEDAAEIHGDHIPEEASATIQNPDTVTMDVNTTLKRVTDSPPTENSSNKIMKRKQTNSIAFELDENVPVAKWTNLKKEKA